MNSLAQKKSSRMTVSTNMSGVSRKTDYRNRNREKTQEQMRRDYEIRKTKDNYLGDVKETNEKRAQRASTGTKNGLSGVQPGQKNGLWRG